MPTKHSSLAWMVTNTFLLLCFLKKKALPLFGEFATQDLIRVKQGGNDLDLLKLQFPRTSLAVAF